MIDSPEDQNDSILLHIVLVGFNHRKGGEVEFFYPNIGENKDPENLPAVWKFLPTLCLPDGSHNYEEDTVFFVLPSNTQDRKSVFGISCFRQIPVESLKNRTSDITRSSVQKAVCVLLKYPIYGHIEVKLSLIAQSFFDQGDFSKREILIHAYDYLRKSLADYPLSQDMTLLTPPSGSQIHPIHVGLSLRELMLKWKYKILTLFKLLLLERRVIFFGSPVRPICSLILAINSLHPLLLETGFDEVAFIRSRATSPIPKSQSSTPENEKPDKNEIIDEEKAESNENLSTNIENEETEAITVNVQEIKNDSSPEDQIDNGDLIMEPNTDKSQKDSSAADSFANNMLSLCSISPSSWIAPLPIYKNGYLCLPFISLSYMDLITDISVYAYVIGASNVLYRQKRNLIDVLVDVQNVSIETGDEGLKRSLQPSTEDLRFIDYVMKNVQNPKENGDGNENWIRRQFYGYFVAMLRTSYEINVSGSAKNLEHFNSLYMQAWQKTNHYQDWLAKMITATAQNSDQIKPFIELQSGHPFSGTSLTVQDMKIRIAQTMQNSESGRRINQAYTSAKSTLSTWFSSLSSSELEKEKSIKLDDKIEVSGKSNKKDNVDEVAVEVTEKLV